MNLLCLICHQDFIDAAKHMSLIITIAGPDRSGFRAVNRIIAISLLIEFLCGFLHRQIEVPHDHVLTRCNDWLSILWTKDVVATKHHDECFGSCFFTQRYVNSHLVTVKVGVEGSTYQWMQTHGTSFHQLRFEGLDTQTVQCRRTVHQNRIAVNDTFHNIPDTWILTIDQLLRSLRIACNFFIYDFIDDKRLEQLNCHFTRQTALIHFQIRSDRDNRTTGEVNTLTEQVLTETSLFSL